MYGSEASYAHYVFMMMNSSHCGWSWPLWLNLSDSPWVLGGVEFRINAKESQVLFGLLCDVLGPCQYFYFEGGKFVDEGVTWKSYERSLCEVEVVGGIAT